MPTISHIVKKEVRNHPKLEDFIERDLISFHRLARFLLPRIKAELGEDVNEGAVVMALSRLREKMVGRRKKEVKTPAWGEVELSMRSGVVEIDVQKGKHTLRKVESLYGLISKPQEEIFNIVQGQYEFTIITNKKYLQKFLDNLKGEKIIHIEEGLALVYLRFPQEVLYTPGFFDRALRELSWSNINVFEIVSTLTELVLVISEDKVGRAYDVLRKAFSPAKE